MRRALRERRDVQDVVVVVTGIGQVAAAASAMRRVGGCRAVVVCGLGGGLGGAAGPGDVVVASRLLDAGGCEPGPVAAVDVVGAIHGAVASVAGVVDDVEARAGLLALGAVVVETEAAAWARACARAGVPLTVVRAVIDTPGVPLGVGARLVQPGAAGPRARDLLQVAMRPRAWPGLLALGRLAGPAQRRAAEAAVSAAVALADPAFSRRARW